MKKIKLTGNESYSNTRTSEVVLKFKNGEKFYEKVSLAEMFNNPKKEKEYVIQKFRDIASSLMTGERVEQIIKFVDSLEKVDNMSNITEHFRD